MREVAALRRTPAALAAAVVALGACEDAQPPAACDPLPQVTIHTGETAPVTACFVDPNGDVLSYSAVSSNSGVAAVSISGTRVAVTAVSPGSASVTVTARDPGGLEGMQRFDVVVPNRAPQPTGTIPPATVSVGQSAATDVSSYFTEPDGDALSYAAASSHEDLAGVAVSGSTVTITAIAKGTVTVAVTAKDPGGLSAEQSFEVTVPNRAPVAMGEVEDIEVEVDSAAEVDVAGRFEDPDGDALTYAAISSDSAMATVSVSGSVAKVTGVAKGTVTITVTATDTEGLSAELAFEVTVPNRAPVAVGEVDDLEVEVDSAAEVDVASRFEDPDGDALTYAATSSDPAMATVSVSVSVATVTGVAKGTVTITVTATDTEGLSAELAFQVTVPNRAPVAVGEVEDLEVSVDSAAEVDVAAYFEDPDGDALTYAAASSRPAVASASVSGSVAKVTGVAKGTATITVTATDTEGLSAELAFQVTVPNRAPVAVGEVQDLEVAVDSAAEVEVAGRFEDPDGDALAYAATSSSPARVTVSVSGSVATVTGVAKGTVTITVTATDTEGLSAELAFQVTVPNRAPVAVGEVEDMEVEVDSAAEVDVAGRFEDPDGDALAYAATSSSPAMAEVSVSGSVAKVTGVAKGTVTITVIATDTEGLSAELAFQVTVPNRAPVAVGELEDLEVAVDSAAEVDVASRFEDPDGDALTYAAISSDPAMAEVSVSVSVARVTGVAKGTVTVTVTATDTEGLSAELAFQVTVPNRAPVVVGEVDDMELEVDSTAEVDVASRFEDPDGDALAYAAISSGPAMATVSVSGSVATVTGVAKGTVTVTVTATDTEGLSAELAFQVTVPNRPPVAVGEVEDMEVEVDSAAEVYVAGRFEDPDGDALAYAATSSDPARVTVSVSGSVVTVAGVAKGAAAVTVTATDTEGLSAVQSFQVTVQNRAPVAVAAIADLEVEVGASASIDASDHFEDPDGDVLTFAASSSDAGVAGVAVSGSAVTVNAIAKGTATVTVTATDPEGLSAEQSFRVTVPNRAPTAVGSIADLELAGDAATVEVSDHFEDPDGDALVYAATSSSPAVASVSVSGSVVTVTAIAKGTATVTVTATDPEGLSAEQSFEVTVPNRAPVAVGEVEDLEVEVDASATVEVSDHFEDPDGDALTYAAASSSPAVASVSVSGSEVTVTGVAKGTATVTVTATDTEGLSAEQSFEVTVPNRAPVAVGEVEDIEVEVDRAAEVEVSDHFEDPDGDALAYSATSSSPAVASVLVSGSVVTVTAVAKGTATVTVTATDPEGLSAVQSFLVTVPNRAPVAVGEAEDLEVEVDASLEVDASDHFEDPDGDALAYSATSSDPAVASVVVSGGVVTVTGVAKGTATVTVTATDPEGLWAEQSFQVTAPNRAPVAVGEVEDLEVEVDSTAEVDVAGHFEDPDGDVLTYAAASSSPAVASVSVSGSVVTVTGVAKGTVTVTVTATDTEGLSAEQSFRVQVTVDVDDPDRATLEALYDALGGDDWTNNTGWKTNAPLGEWHGVTTNADGWVVGLDLNNNGLAGQIPREIDDLARLEELYLFGNSLTGQIPTEIGNLPSLADLRLGGNALTGQVPPEIGDLSNLGHLWLQDNALTGQVPLELGNLSNVQTLYLNATSLEGPLPNELVGLPLNHFYWDDSELCAPGNSAFQSWLDSIDNRDGDDCPTFDLGLRFTSSVSSPVRSDISDARDKWELALVDTELDDVDFDRDVTCFGLTAYVGTVDDHEFWVHVDSIDGEGGVLARAGYCYRRTADSTPLISASTIDSADVGNMEDLDALVPVMFHEMAHGLGFSGTHFELLDLLDKDEGGDPDPHFEGVLAIEAFDDAGGDGYQGEKVPVQLGVYAHWRESIFGDEIMTPSIDLDNDESPISAITLQAMADMGYEADLARADDYELPAFQYRRRGRTVLDLGNDVVHMRVMVVDADGRVVRVIPPPPGIRRQPLPWRDVRVEPEGRRR